MKELIEFVLPESIKSIQEKIITYKKNSVQIPKGYTKEEFQSDRAEVIEFISKLTKTSFQDQLIFATGHQPDFHHPGILAKDLLIHRLSKELNGLPLHIIVDTDQFHINFTYPILVTKNQARLVNLSLGQKNSSIYNSVHITDGMKEMISQELKNCLNSLHEFIHIDQYNYCKSKIIEILDGIENSQDIQNVSEKLRLEFLQENQIQIPIIRVSELIQTKAFINMVQKIKNRQSEFVSKFNHHLHEYRKLHKIKNIAQPIPELGLEELPFWILSQKTETREPLKANDDLTSHTILPRAITLTMFIRLFISDFFVHGTGGGRYEDVSNHLIQDFFEIQPSPYIVCSSTMRLSTREKFEHIDFNLQELDTKLREIQYSPEKLLGKDHPLAVQKLECFQKMKEPSANKKEIHQSIVDLNQKMGELLSHCRKQLEEIQSIKVQLQKNQEVFTCRTFPFFFYRVQELVKYVQEL